MKKRFGRFMMISLIGLLVLTGCATTGSATPVIVPGAFPPSVVTQGAAAESTSSAVSTATAVAPDATATPTAASAATSAPNAASTGLPSTGGTLTFTVVSGQSTADYRVQEQLARLNFPTEAVGKTNAVSGAIVIQPDGTIVSSKSQIVVDVTNLTSDSAMRDRYVRANILQTSQYPQVVFVPDKVTGLASPLPTSGNISFQLTGNLTVRNVTKPVTWDVTGQVQNGQITAHATTNFKFEDFNLSQPQVPVVLGVTDKITLEADLVMKEGG